MTSSPGTQVHLVVEDDDSVSVVRQITEDLADARRHADEINGAYDGAVSATVVTITPPREALARWRTRLLTLTTSASAAELDRWAAELTPPARADDDSSDIPF